MNKKTEIRNLAIRKKCRTLAEFALKAPLFFSQPITDVQEPEINYYAFTLVNLLNAPGINVISLAQATSDVLLPVMWNYLDGACSVAMGLSQLLNEDDYRQGQLKIKGVLNILSGVQLFLLSYNPPLIAALGITGAPTLLAGASFALAMAVDLVCATMDYLNARNESTVEGWLDEKAKEYRYLCDYKKKLQDENNLLQQDLKLKDLLIANQKKLVELEKNRIAIEAKIQLRYKVHADKESVSAKKASLEAAGLNFPREGVMDIISKEEQLRDAYIQEDCIRERHKKRDTLLIKSASFVGMSLAATSALALFSLCPLALPTLGIAITVVVSCLYLFRHYQEIANRKQEIIDGVSNNLGSLKRSVGAFFSHATAEVSRAEGLRDNFVPVPQPG